MGIQSNNQTQRRKCPSPSPGLHINEIMPRCSQLQPLPDRCLWSKTTSHRSLGPTPLLPSHHSFARALEHLFHTTTSIWVKHYVCISSLMKPPPPLTQQISTSNGQSSSDRGRNWLSLPSTLWRYTLKYRIIWFTCDRSNYDRHIQRLWMGRGMVSKGGGSSSSTRRQRAAVAWRSPIFHRVNTDDNTLVFKSPISFYGPQFTLHAFKGPLESHTERTEHSVWRDKMALDGWFTQVAVKKKTTSSS